MKKLILVFAIGIFLLSFASARLIEYWNFNENTGTNAENSIVSTSHNITLTAANLWKTGKSGTGVNTTGTTGVATDFVNYTGATDITYNFWVYRTGDVGTYSGIIYNGAGGAGSSNGEIRIMSYGATNRLTVDLHDSVGTPDALSAVAIPINQWTMLTIKLNNTGLEIFYNGTSMDTQVLNNFIFDNFNDGFWQLDGGASDITNMVFDEMMIFNRSLSTIEISALYNSGAGTFYPMTVTLGVPANSATILSPSILFNATVSGLSNITNATLNVWTSAGSLYFSSVNASINNLMSSNFNWTVSPFLPGSYKWNVYGCSTFEGCVWASANRTFSYGLIVNSVEYNLTSYETASEPFFANITYNSTVYSSILANLIYNGTSYSATKIGTGDNVKFYKSISVPTQPANYSFYWNFQIYNSTSEFILNSSAYYQYVNAISLQLCNGTTHNVTVANFTVYDETNGTRLMPFSFSQATFNYWIGGALTSKNLSFSQTNVNETKLCITPGNQVFQTNALLSYGKTGYVTREYFFINNNLTNASQEIKLYLLPDADATTFIIKVQDINQVPLQDYYVYIQRYYPETDSYQTVQVVQTDDNGKTVGFYQTETVYYRHIITNENGTIVLTTDKQKIFGETVPYTLTFTIGEAIETPWTNLKNLTDMSYSLTFNETTKIVKFIYVDESSKFDYANLTVTWNKPSAIALQVCTDYSELIAATLSCNLSNYTTGTFTAKVHYERTDSKDRDFIITFDIDRSPDTFGKGGLFLAYLIIMTAGLIFLYNQIAGVWAVTAAVIFTNIIGLAAFSLLFIFSILAIAVILTVMLRSGT